MKLFCSHDYEFHHWVHHLSRNSWDIMILRCTKCGKLKFGGEYWMPDLLSNRYSFDKGEKK